MHTTQLYDSILIYSECCGVATKLCMRNKGCEMSRCSHHTNYLMAPSYTPMGACHHGGSRFIALDTPLCPRFMPRPRAFFRNTYLLHDIGAASPVAPDFSITTAASDACEFRSPTSSRGDNGVVGLTPWHSVRAPLRSHVPLAGRVMSAVYPPSSGASIGGVPRFMGVR